MSTTSTTKFDASRAAEYLVQSRIGLAGYDACHELSACILAATLGQGREASILVVGAGGGGSEIATCGRLEKRWRFTAVDPSPPMLALAMDNVAQAGLADRVRAHEGVVADLPVGGKHDAATLIGVLHHLPGEEAKRAILADVAARLRPGAALVVAGNYRPYASEPLLMKAWAERWRMNGADPAEVEAKLNKILQGADPPASEEALIEMLSDAGFEQPLRFFGSLFWGAWVARLAG